MTYINECLAIIAQHTLLAYGIIFLTCVSESLALVGLIVPGTMIMFAIGAVVSTGSLDLVTVLVLATAGAIAGDGLSYWLGRRYREQLQKIWPFSRYPGMLRKGAVFFNRHGKKSVLLGRFIGPIRPVIPVIAGMMGMGPLAFSLINVVSAIGWALVYILPGFFFGASLAVAGVVSTRLAALALIFLAAVWGFLRLGQGLLFVAGRHGPVWFLALKAWAASGTPVPRALRPVRLFFSWLFLRTQGEEVFLGVWVLVLSLASWGFFSVLQDVLAKDPLVLADQAVYHFFYSLRTPWADHLFIAITELGDSPVNICLFFAVLVVLVGHGCLRTAGFWILAVLGGLAGVQMLKWIIHLPRPMAIYHGASAFGFPSGHTTMSVILYGFLAILVTRNALGSLRWKVFTFVLLISFIIALSRLYLGAHWLSDVLGGFFAGTSWTVLLGIAWLKKPAERLPRRLLGLAAILAVIMAGTWHVSRQHEKDLSLYTPVHAIQTMDVAEWQGHAWQDLPAWRFDMAGEKEQPLTLQWAGAPDVLARHLFPLGWSSPAPVALKTLLKLVSPDASLENLPVFPRLHSGRMDTLRLVYKDNDQRWVLRLWPSDARILEGGLPLFVGTVEIQRLRHITGLITASMDTGEYDRALAGITEMLKNQKGLTPVRQTRDDRPEDSHGKKMHWQGQVLLIREEVPPLE